MSDSAETTVVLPKQKRKKKTKRKKKPDYIPQFHLVLWNDDDHTYEYVIVMLYSIFGYEVEKGFQLAQTVDQTGKVILLTASREYAEFKQDQIHAYGADPSIPNCAGSMTATVEPAG